MTRYKLSRESKILEGGISLPITKSINTRFLCFRALHISKSENKFEEANTIDDTIIPKNISKKADFRMAVRYIRAFFNYFQGVWVLSGIEKQGKGPVSSLVKKLQKEGIKIKFEERAGHPPLKLIGKNLKGLFTRVEGSVSSKMINASLFIAPNAPSSLILEIKDRIVNSSYIELSLKALHYLGVNTDWNNVNTLLENEFKDGSEITIEADWNSVAYWYAFAAIADNLEFHIGGVVEESVQCDSILKDLFIPFGVKTINAGNGVKLTKIKKRIKEFEFDFTNNPDLVQVMMITCIALKIPFRIKGFGVMLSKQPDGFISLHHELRKFGADIKLEKSGEQDVLCFNGKLKRIAHKDISISADIDHRFAMIFSIFSYLGKNIIIENPMLTSKSYPTFWDDMKKAGFTVEVAT